MPSQLYHRTQQNVHKCFKANAATIATRLNTICTKHGGSMRKENMGIIQRTWQTGWQRPLPKISHCPNLYTVQADDHSARMIPTVSCNMFSKRRSNLRGSCPRRIRPWLHDSGATDLVVRTYSRTPADAIHASRMSAAWPSPVLCRCVLNIMLCCCCAGICWACIC